MPVHTAAVHPLGRARSVTATPRTTPPDSTATPTPVAVDLGSGQVRIWAAARGTLSVATGDGLGGPSVVRRGRIIDGPGCVALLSQLLRGYRPPVPTGSLIVACRPVLATAVDQHAIGRVLDTVFAPARLLFIDSVRAAAIGAGAAAGTLIIADIGAQVTEVAVLDNGAVLAARRVDLGTRDITLGASSELLADTVARLIEQLRREPRVRSLDAALARGLFIVGDGATRPELITHLRSALRVSVHRAAGPRTAALTGAGLAATSAVRHSGNG